MRVIRTGREAYQTPADIAAILAREGGLNRFGEPNYRAVWGRSRLAWIGGKFEDRDDHGELLRECVETRFEPKYELDRWIIERWMPPETYGSPWTWLQQTRTEETGFTIDELGPYPSRGEYEHLWTAEDTDGSFLQLTPALARRVVRLCERNRVLPKSDIRAARAATMEKKDKAYRSYADSVLSDGPAFGGRPFVQASA